MPDLAQIDARIVQLTRQPTLAVRVQRPIPEMDLAALFDRYLPLVGARIREAGAATAGAPFGRYHRFGPELVDVEIGRPSTPGRPVSRRWRTARPATSARPSSPAATRRRSPTSARTTA